MATSHPDLRRALSWLDARVNYEKTGPQAGPDNDFTHDPERRLRHLRRFMELMGEPHTLYPSIHVTGTNGKTSTTRILTSLLLAQGLTTGTYTSPHLESLNERIQVNAEPIGDDDLAEALHALELLEPLLEGATPSYFELLTAAAFRHFADAPVDAAVVEVGVGGQWDATNVIDGLVSVVTNVGLDHTNYLGPTRRHIAAQKSGIIKPGSVAVIGEPDEEFDQLWSDRQPARLLKVDRDFEILRNDVAVGGRMLELRTPLATYEDLFLSLHGAYQGVNAAIALTSAEAFFEQALSEEVVRQALGTVTSPGRMEVVHRSPLCVIDGAHNAEGAAALASTLDQEFAHIDGRIVVVGMLRGHDPAEVLPALRLDRARLVIACTAPSPRAVPAEDIAEVVKGLGVPCAAVPDVATAVEEALAAASDEDMVVITGSLYVAGAARTVFATREGRAEKPLA